MSLQENKENTDIAEARKWKQENVGKHGWVTENLMIGFSEFKNQQLQKELDKFKEENNNLKEVYKGKGTLHFICELDKVKEMNKELKFQLKQRIANDSTF